MVNDSNPRPIATLWQLAWNEDRVACVVYRRGSELTLRIESPTAVIVSERFQLQPRMLARSRALHNSMKRRGWRDLPT